MKSFIRAAPVRKRSDSPTTPPCPPLVRGGWRGRPRLGSFSCLFRHSLNASPELAQQSSCEAFADSTRVVSGFHAFDHPYAVIAEQLTVQRNRLILDLSQRTNRHVTAGVDRPEEPALGFDLSPRFGVIDRFNKRSRLPMVSRLYGQRSLGRSRDKPVDRQVDPVRWVETEPFQAGGRQNNAVQ